MTWHVGDVFLHIYREHDLDGYDGTWGREWHISIRAFGFGTDLSFSLWRYRGKSK